MGIEAIRKNRMLSIGIVLIISAAFLVGLIWVNVQFSRNNPGGNDFLAHYVGTRALIFEGKSPYSEEVALEIQRRVFGRPAEPGEIEHRVVYPLYSIIIFAPFALIKEYAIARVAWMTVIEISLLATGFLALRITKWKPKLIILILYYQFAVLWYHGFRAVINGNAVILVGLFITGSLYALLQENEEAAGILLALSTIKPNLSLLYISFVLLWCVYQKRFRIILWFFGGMLFLILGGMVLIPDWILQNIWEILRYPGYNPPVSIGEVLGLVFPGIASIIRWGIGIVLGLLLGYEVWAARKKKADWFIWTACLTLTISQWIGIATDPGNFVILFTPFVLILARLEERWKDQSRYLTPVILGTTFFGLWFLFIATINFEYQPMQSSIMFFPFPGMILVGLYWIKWWVVGGGSTLWQEIS